jgi:hypothetical protein
MMFTIKAILATIFTFSGASFLFGSTCTDSTYVRLKSTKINEVNRVNFEEFLKLDSLCKLEIHPYVDSGFQKGIAETKIEPNSKLILDNSSKVKANSKVEKYNDEPYDSETNGRIHPKFRRGRGWFWTSLVVGGLYFTGSSIAMSTISDQCSLIFITDLFKSEEQCKEEADNARQVAGIGMFFGGILSAIGIYGLAATSPSSGN